MNDTVEGPASHVFETLCADGRIFSRLQGFTADTSAGDGRATLKGLPGLRFCCLQWRPQNHSRTPHGQTDHRQTDMCIARVLMLACALA